MKLKEVKKKLLKDPEFKKEYERFDLWFEIQQLWVELRIKVLSFFERGKL